VRRLKSWKCSKNRKSQDWIRITNTIRKRELEGKDSEVFIDGKQVDPRKLRKELSRNRQAARKFNHATSQLDLIGGAPTRSTKYSTPDDIVICSPRDRRALVQNGTLRNRARDWAATDNDADDLLVDDQSTLAHIGTGKNIPHKARQHPVASSLIANPTPAKRTFDHALFQSIKADLRRHLLHSPHLLVEELLSELGSSRDTCMPRITRFRLELGNPSLFKSIFSSHTMWSAIELAKHYRTQRNLKELIELIDVLGSLEPKLFTILGKAHLLAYEEEQATAAFAKSICAVGEGLVYLSMEKCNGCAMPLGGRMGLLTGHYICKQCADADFCRACYSSNSSGRVSLHGCTSHAFFNVFSLEFWLTQKAAEPTIRAAHWDLLGTTRSTFDHPSLPGAVRYT
jgi:hypothetical protein